jgi:hypothetical protein
MTAEDFRDIALSMRGAVERAHMNHPDFRASGKIFATLHADNESGVVKLSPAEQREFIRMYPTMFSAAAGAWGRQGWTKVLLAASNAPAVRGAMMLAWQNVVEKPSNRESSKPARGPRAKSSRKR